MQIRIKFSTDIGISTTGISGPKGGSNNKPVGLVYISVVTNKERVVKKLNLTPVRKKHREDSANIALNMLRIMYPI